MASHPKNAKHLQEIPNLQQLANKAPPSYAQLQARVEELEEANSNLVVAKLQMAHLANHDFLTGLPNRIQLQERLYQAVRLAERNHRKLAVVFLDIDRFKVINDSLGHHLGDKLIKAVAERLSMHIRSSDTVCRQGGDEFVILLPEIESVEDAISLVEKITSALEEPIIIHNKKLKVTLSLGISVFPDNTRDPDVLIKHADTAMYQAKENGRGQYQVFTNDMAHKVANRQSIENGLKLSMQAGELELYYQPKINFLDQSITGVEALIRWHHPELGTLLPEDFIALAEESGSIVQLTRWVLKKACEQIKTWLNEGHQFGRVSVNVSALDFQQPDFIDHIKHTLEGVGLEPSALEIEITESVLMKDAPMAIQLLNELHELGVVIAIDDFGTGYSSLSYLKQLPIGVLKIDQSFLSEIPSNSDDEVIAVAIINLGLGLNLEVVAEGIETIEQIDFLLAHRCHTGQGFFYNKPMNAGDFTGLLHHRVHNH